MSDPKLAAKVHSEIENDGIYDYFSKNGPDYEDLVNLGFDKEKIQTAFKASIFLDGVFGEVEEMMEF